MVGVVDPYALVVFEGYAARTHMARNTREPRWGADVPRAFRFPIRCPYATCDIALLDSDADPFADDGIGRVCLDLSLMQGRTTYDCWFALQYDHRMKARGKRGSVRLRFSVVWHSDRLRVLRYPRPAPSFAVPFKTRKQMRNAAFAVQGRAGNPAAFQWHIFNTHVSELQEMYDAVVGAFLSFVFWEVRRTWQRIPDLPLHVLGVARYHPVVP